MMSVYGPTIKEIVHEKCGDGIVSAIDFAMNIEKKPDPKGDRIVITLDGKFLPYKSLYSCWKMHCINSAPDF